MSHVNINFGSFGESQKALVFGTTANKNWQYWTDFGQRRVKALEILGLKKNSAWTMVLEFPHGSDQ